MSRPVRRLDGVDLLALEPGLHADGAGLYLRVDWTGARRWALIDCRGGRRREMGLGGLRSVSLASARAAARNRKGTRGGVGSTLR